MNFGTSARIVDPVTREAIVRALRRGDTVVAIRHYRLATGAGAAEAKRAVESMRIASGIEGVRGSHSVRTMSLRGPLLLAILVAIVCAWYFARAH